MLQFFFQPPRHEPRKPVSSLIKKPLALYFCVAGLQLSQKLPLGAVQNLGGGAEFDLNKCENAANVRARRRDAGSKWWRTGEGKPFKPEEANEEVDGQTSNRSLDQRSAIRGLFPSVIAASVKAGFSGKAARHTVGEAVSKRQLTRTLSAEVVPEVVLACC